ncbi:MAG: glycosyltransferase family 4 protein [Nitrospirae bacterium]|nr:glycosyltransferase family 4 protein [Nitrospirota bacterium]
MNSSPSGNTSGFKKIDILQVNNYHYVRGGAERYYFELARLLEEHGHRVHYFSVKHEENLPSPYTSYFGRPMSFDTGQGVLRKLETAFRMLYSFENNRLMGRLLADHRVDIAHAHNIYHRVCPSVFDVLRRHDVPVVMTLHDYKLGCSTYSFYRNGHICTECLSDGKVRVIRNRCTKGSLTLSLFHFLEAEIHGMLDIYGRNVSFFICPSMFSLRKHAEIGVAEEKLVHIPNFINISAYEPDYEGQDYILFAGRLSQEKGVRTLLDAVEGLDVELRIVGDGPMRQEYMAYAGEKGLNNVLFEGYKTGKELEALFRGAAFLVLPSEWYENAPMTVLEAFAYGKCVVGSDIGGIPELVLDGRTGLLFRAGDHEDLREKITDLVSNRSTAAMMGREARRRAEEEYNEEVHYHRLMGVYERAAGKSSL